MGSCVDRSLVSHYFFDNLKKIIEREGHMIIYFDDFFQI